MVSVSTVSFSNAASCALEIWIEPWCDALELPTRSTVVLEPVALTGIDPLLPEVTIDGDTIVVWAGGPGTLTVSIDGTVEDTGLRTIELPPELFDIPVKHFVETVFGAFPAARPGGERLAPRRPLWKRLLGR